MFAFLSAPIDTPTLSPFPSCPSLCSVADNDIGDTGASALAAVLNETQIQHLECAAAPERSLLSQCPLTRLSTHVCSHARSLRYNSLGPEGGAAVAEGLKGNSTLQWLE